jgi:hypothetical protein
VRVPCLLRARPGSDPAPSKCVGTVALRRRASHSSPRPTEPGRASRPAAGRPDANGRARAFIRLSCVRSDHRRHPQLEEDAHAQGRHRRQRRSGDRRSGRGVGAVGRVERRLRLRAGARSRRLQHRHRQPVLSAARRADAGVPRDQGRPRKIVSPSPIRPRSSPKASLRASRPTSPPTTAICSRRRPTGTRRTITPTSGTSARTRPPTSRRGRSTRPARGRRAFTTPSRA